jgi:hypothetical protein
VRAAATPRFALTLALSTACAGTLHADAEAARSGDCAAISDVSAQERCTSSAGNCDALTGRAANECRFRAAERASDAELCAHAGELADECRLHLVSRAFLREFPRARPGADDAAAEILVTSAGLALDDPRPWSAWYRHALGAQVPIDRGRCASVTLPLRREACEHTGLALYNDRLNMARDRGLYPCDGGPLPILLQRAPDPELDALVASRTDLCPSPR